MKKNALPTRYARAIREALQAHGIADDVWMQRAGLTPGMLEDETAWLDLKTLQNIIGVVRELNAGWPLAIEAGARILPTAHGMLGVAGMTSPTPADGLRLAVHYFPLVCPLVELHYTESGDYGILTATRRFDDREVFAFLMQMLVASLDAQVRFLMQSAAVQATVDVPWPQPNAGTALAQRLHSMRGLSWRFDRPMLSMHVPLILLRQRNPLANAAMCAQARRECDAVLRASGARHTGAMLARAQLESGEGGMLSERQLAEQLHLSTRSLRRQLQAQGLSFRELSLQSRMRQARALIEAGMPLTRVAEQLGYREFTSFSRAFRRHVGMAPSAYRRQHQSSCA